MKYNMFDLIMSDDIKAVKKALKKNPELLNSVDGMGRTPLMETAVFKRIEICKFLLDRGADVNIVEVGNWTALHFAAQSGSYEITKMLLEKGAQVNIKNKFGNTPLFNALMNSGGEGDVIKLLLQHGADKDIENNYGNSPYKIAKMVDNFNLMQFFE